MSAGAVTQSSGVSQKWKLTDAIVLGVVLFVVLVVGYWYISPAIKSSIAIHFTSFQRSQLALLIVLILQLGAAAIVFVATRRLPLGDALNGIEWNPSRYGRTCAFMGIVLAAVMTLAAGLVLRGTSRFADGFAPLSISLYVLTSVVIGPFIEECYFRGVLFIALLNKVGALGSVILTAVLFAAVHPFYRLVWIFLTLGLVLGVARIKTKSVAACFVLHAAYNFGILGFQLLSGAIR